MTRLASRPGPVEQGIEVGVLALQGDFRAHADALARAGASVRFVRVEDDLVGLDGIVLPGGESTTMGKLLRSNGLFDPLRRSLLAGLPAFGTCAGLILCAAEIVDPARNDQETLRVCDIAVRRNAYGRQMQSHEQDLDIDLSSLTGVAPGPVRAVFIRAPRIERVGEAVEVLSWQNGSPVVVRQGSMLLCTFHPELTDDVRLHRLFLSGLERRHGIFERHRPERETG